MQQQQRTTVAPRLTHSMVIAYSRMPWLIVFGVTLGVYFLTAHWQAGQNTDGLVAALPSWHLVAHGTLDLRGFIAPEALPGVIDSGDRVVVSRTMGVILSGLPGALLVGWAGAPAGVTGALSASLFTAAAVANVHLAMRSFLPAGTAVLGTSVLAFGTGMWTLASAELWTHGPDAFWLSAALLFASRRSWLLTGLAFAPAILTRPHLAVSAAVLGLWLMVTCRSLRPVISVGVPSVGALGIMTLWNGWYYGAATVGGTYGYAVPNATRSVTSGTGQFAENLAGVLFSPLSGLFVYTPVLLVVVVAALRGHWRQPPWTMAFAAAGLTYLIVQMRISFHFDGGGGYFGNRYGIETLVMLSPFATAAAAAWAAELGRRLAAASVLAGWSIAVHAFGAFLTYWWFGTGTRSSWITWYPYFVAREAGPTGVAAGVACLAVVGLSYALARRHSDKSQDLPHAVQR